MHDFVKKLKASTPNVLGQEAAEIYRQFFSDTSTQESFKLFHSHDHGHDKIILFIETFISTFAKIEGYTGQYLYSYQPFQIGIYEEDITLPSGKVVKLTTWFSMYTNCFIGYTEAKDTEVFDIFICVRNDELEKIMELHGSQEKEE